MGGRLGVTGSARGKTSENPKPGGGLGSSGVYGGSEAAIEDRSIAKPITFHQAGT
jgi:hypothetical protein